MITPKQLLDKFREEDAKYSNGALFTLREVERIITAPTTEDAPRACFFCSDPDCYNECLDTEPEDEFDPAYYWEHMSEEHKYSICEKIDNQIAKRRIGEYIKDGLPIKYNAGAPYGWEKGITYKYEVEILQDCINWLQQEDK